MNTKINMDKEYKLMYLLYGVVGGFYYSSLFQKNMKYLWIILNTVALTIVNTASVVHLITTKNVRPEDACFSIFVSCGSVLLVLVIPNITYYFRNELEIVMSVIENEFNLKDVKNINNGTKPPKNSRADIYTMIIVILTLFFVNLIYEILFTILNETEVLKDVPSYAVPMPFAEYIGSLPVLMLILIVCESCQAFLFLVNTSHTIYIILLIYEFYNATTIIIDNMEFISDDMTQAIETLHKKQLELYELNDHQEEKYLNFSHFENEIKNHQKEFLKRVKLLIKKYKIFSKTLAYMKTYIQIIFSIILTGYFFYVIIFMLSQFLIFPRNSTFNQQIKAMLSWCPLITLFYYFCNEGEKFNDASVRLANGVYSLPWYYLTPAQRKDIYIFLCQTQAVAHLYGLKVFPCRRSTFLAYSKFLYTTLSVLRAKAHT